MSRPKGSSEKDARTEMKKVIELIALTIIAEFFTIYLYVGGKFFGKK